MHNCPYVAFDGPIGVGKTTLTELLAYRIGATPVYEDVAGNEFLADFYGDQPRWALGMQLSFWLSRYEQLANVHTNRTQPVVADYTPWKDGLFAKRLLRDRELRLYDKISARFNRSVAEPDVFVYLDADTETLLQRIRGRGRTYEDRVNARYLDTLREDYELAISSFEANRLLRFDTTNLRLQSKEQLTTLFDEILERAKTNSRAYA